MTIPPDDDATPQLEPSDPARILLGQMVDKWSILIISQLCPGPLRFNALKRSVSGVTQKALTQSLRRLERNGVIERRVLPGSPPAVEYRITELGHSVVPPMRSLYAWAVDRLPEVESARLDYDQNQQNR